MREATSYARILAMARAVESTEGELIVAAVIPETGELAYAHHPASVLVNIVTHYLSRFPNFGREVTAKFLVTFDPQQPLPQGLAMDPPPTPEPYPKQGWLVPYEKTERAAMWKAVEAASPRKGRRIILSAKVRFLEEMASKRAPLLVAAACLPLAARVHRYRVRWAGSTRDDLARLIAGYQHHSCEYEGFLETELQRLLASGRLARHPMTEEQRT